MKYYLSFILTLIIGSLANAQTGKIEGKVTDRKDAKALSGASIVIKDTTLGTYTDMEGKYQIKDLPPGKYTLIVTYISYDVTEISVTVKANETTVQNIEMGNKVVVGKEVKIKGKIVRKPSTEKAVIAEVKQSNNVVSAISGEQINKSQDRDAAEVVKRVPGVTVIDNRFIMVRGLSDRYNSVFLNGVGTASSEADKKSFSFDIIPSALIDKILIFKTPSAELPGDFAGGMVKIFTKTAVPENKLTLNFALGYRAGTTFNGFSYSEGSPTDVLGFDDGTRKIPVGPLLQASEQERKDAALQFKNNWAIKNRTALPDGRFNLTYGNKINIRSMKLVSISNLNYTNTNTTFNIRRKDFDPDRDLIDQQYTNLVRLGALQNFALTINKHNSVEFRNLFNQFGRTQTTLRNSVQADAPNEKGYAMGYQSRGVLSSQLSGNHESKNERIAYTWTGGYTSSNRNEPDLKRLKYTKQQDQPDSQYTAAIPSGSASPEFGVRFYSKLHENLYSFNHNLRLKLSIKDYDFEVNAGSYMEFKQRHFEARLLGYVINPGPAALSLRKQDIANIFSYANVRNPQGFSIDEITEPNYTYDASNKLFAEYASILLPYKDKIKFIAGLRYEDNLQSLNSYLDQEKINPQVHTKKFLPSFNLSYNFTKKALVRGGYGRTLNRPEFREWSPFKFYDFDFGTDIYGSLFKTVLPGSGTVLKTATIDNYDLRFELYPSNAEMIHIGGFYKKFTDPIEQYILPSSNRIFTYANAANAYSRGVELDLRKNLSFIGNRSLFNNLTFITNVSLIQSRITLNYSFGQDLKRPLQGQSPYVINSGFYYQSDSIGLQVSLLYNVIGPRIFLVGTSDYPSWGEMPKQNLDLTITKRLSRHFALNLGIQDILNQPVLIVQDSNKNGKFERHGDDLHIMEFKRGSYYTAGFKYVF